MKELTKEYTNGEVTIVWKNALCSHSANCVRGLPEVFNSRVQPWIKPESSSTDKIIEQVKKCPSGALSYYLNDTNT
jgi:uncharacterized Fe-S cluster protein YjdI